jgi:hypothetical protein
MAENENPFENQPMDYERRRARATSPSPAPAVTPARADPFQGRASWEGRKKPATSPFQGVKARTEGIDPANLGFFGVFALFFAVLLYIIAAILRGWDLSALTLGIAGGVLAGLMPYFYLGPHLPRGRLPLSPLVSKGVAAGLLGTLLIVVFYLFYVNGSSLPLALTLVSAVVSTWLGVILVLASIIRGAPAAVR